MQYVRSNSIIRTISNLFTILPVAQLNSKWTHSTGTENSGQIEDGGVICTTIAYSAATLATVPSNTPIPRLLVIVGGHYDLIVNFRSGTAPASATAYFHRITSRRHRRRSTDTRPQIASPTHHRLSLHRLGIIPAFGAAWWWERSYLRVPSDSAKLAVLARRKLVPKNFGWSARWRPLRGRPRAPTDPPRPAIEV